MTLDAAVERGRKDKPAVILIHGLGMDKNFWLTPLSTKIFAKNIPLSVFAAAKPKPCRNVSGRRFTLGERPEKIKGLWTVLKDEGFNLVCWSQRRPAGPINIAVEELAWAAEKAKEVFPRAPLALIGHSRGGLIARKFMETKRPEIKALITISTPNRGSSIARLGKYLVYFPGMLKKILPENTHNRISETIKNITGFLEGNAWKELQPDSVFLRELKDVRRRGVRYLSLGGCQPRLLTLYIWKVRGEKMHAEPFLSVPDSLIKALPPALAFDEITPGKGDGLVTAESSVLPWASSHFNIEANHVSIVWDKKTAEIVLKTLGTI